MNTMSMDISCIRPVHSVHDILGIAVIDTEFIYQSQSEIVTGMDADCGTRITADVFVAVRARIECNLIIDMSVLFYSDCCTPRAGFVLSRGNYSGEIERANRFTCRENLEHYCEQQ
jgi:hypothetical protein